MTKNWTWETIENGQQTRYEVNIPIDTKNPKEMTLWIVDELFQELGKEDIKWLEIKIDFVTNFIKIYKIDKNDFTMKGKEDGKM